MNFSSFAIIAISLCALASVAMAIPVKNNNGTCDPEKCKLPDCRCWNDPHKPGNSSQKAPQMVLLSFDYAINEYIVDRYLDIFEGLINPNGCKAKGTFFVQELNSDIPAIKILKSEGHELAINSKNGIIPTNKEEWRESMQAVIDILKKAGVDTENEVKGMRAPQLFNGGNDQFEVMKEFGMSYDASCVEVDYSEPNKLLWPFTLDAVGDMPKCSIGHTVNETFPGMWAFPVPVLFYQGLQCATPSGCIPQVKTIDDVFQLFYQAFDAHFGFEHVPFLIDIDTMWGTKDFRVTGTKEFLQIIASYPDTWIVTMKDALEYVKNPDGFDFSTFGC